MIKTLRIKQGLIFALLIPFLFFSCIEKELDFNNIKGNRWAAQWAVPLVNSSLSINDFLNDSANIIGETEDNVLTLVYESDELVSIRADEIAEIPDQEKWEEQSFDIPDVPPGFNDSVAISFDFSFELDEEGLRIDSLILKNGFYRFVTRTDIDRDVSSIVYTIPNFVHLDTKLPMHFEIDVNNNTGGIIEKDTILDLSSYMLQFDHSFEDTNVVSIQAMVRVVGDDDPNNNPYFIEVGNEFSEMEFSRFYGFMGQQVVQVSDTVSIDIFNYDQEGNFTFSDGGVNLTLDLYNSFGMPVLMEVEKFMAYHEGENPDSVEIYLFGEGNPAEFEVLHPDLAQIGQTVHTQVISDNSNMNEALALSPQSLFIDINALVNHNVSYDETNFILDSSQIRATMKMELELFGSINGFEVIDTVEFNMANTDELESLYFVLDVENGFPVTTTLQLDFVDSLYQVVYTLFPEGEPLMVAGGVGSGPDYRVIYPGIKLTEVELLQEDLETLADARKILVTAILSTEPGQEVKIYSDYEILLKLGAKVGIYY